MNSILNDIAIYKREWVKQCKQRCSEQEVLAQAHHYQPLDFAAALQHTIAKKRNAVIAEVKKASPSRGVIRPDFDPIAIAKDYVQGGACCLSVLTDVQYFQGSDNYLRSIRRTVHLPILRKDFMLDTYQVIEARAMGADAILIIMAMVDDSLAEELTACARELGLSILPEIHNRQELERALQLNTKLIGINNRDLHTFETRLDTTLSLLPYLSEQNTVITESGIFTADDIALMNEHAVYGFLIGESLIRQETPGQALKSLIA